MDPHKKSNVRKANGRLVFIKEFLKHPLQIGSIVPSSRFLEQRVVAVAEAESAQTLVELGPGTGGITRAILRAMPQRATLLSIEINPHFHSLINKIADLRLISHLGSAGDLRRILSEYGLESPDAIISGIPFSTMSRGAGSAILEAVSAVLPPHGRFVAYQVNNHVATLCQPFMGPGQSTREFLNIPPMRIFKWEKPA